jgi:transposase
MLNVILIINSGDWYNQAEQSLRMLKVKHKVSGCFRTMDGANTFFAARSYTAIAQKQSLNIIDTISYTFDGKPLLLT